MSEPTTTRAALRRAICRELQMPFARRFANGVLTMDSGSTTGKLLDATLLQKDRFWNGGWLFIPTTGEISVLRNYASNERSIQLEIPLAAASDSAGNPFEYEIHTLWNAIEIHAAINRAIAIGGRTFPETVRDDTLVLQENVLSYPLSSLAKAPLQINKVWLEHPGNIQNGVAVAGAATTITLPSVPSDITTNWKISIYAGTGKGQIRNYVSHIGNVVTVLAWTTIPDSTSKYALWDATNEQYDWTPFRTVYVDAKEFPDTLNVRGLFAYYYGCRIRLEYLSQPLALSAETDTTVVPSEYIIPKACAILHGQKLNDTNADRDLHYSENQRYDQMAEAYLVRNAPHVPDTNILTQDDHYFDTSLDDPLSWRY